MYKHSKEKINQDDVDDNTDPQSGEEHLVAEEVEELSAEEEEPVNEAPEIESDMEDSNHEDNLDDSVVPDSESGVIAGAAKRSKIAGLYKPPTHDEMQTLKETQNLFKSNLMRLQVCQPSSLCISFFLP